MSDSVNLEFEKPIVELQTKANEIYTKVKYFVN